MKPVFGHWFFDQTEILIHEKHLWINFRIRTGSQTAEDLDLLNSRLLKNLKNKEEFKHCLYIMASKIVVSNHNNEMTKLLQKPSRTYKITAVDTYADRPNAS